MMCFLFCIYFLFSTPTLNEIRELYAEASETKQKTEFFCKVVEKLPSQGLVEQAYRAVAKIVKAKYEKDNKLRKNLLVTGIKNLESLIEKNPKEYEIRLIRLSVQEHLPKAFKYHDNIQEDVRFLLENYSKQENNLQKLVQKYTRKSKKITPELLEKWQ